MNVYFLNKLVDHYRYLKLSRIFLYMLIYDGDTNIKIIIIFKYCGA